MISNLYLLMAIVSLCISMFTDINTLDSAFFLLIMSGIERIYSEVLKWHSLKN